MLPYTLWHACGCHTSCACGSHSLRKPGFTYMHMQLKLVVETEACSPHIKGPDKPGG